MTIYWAIELDNFKEDYFVCYFENFEVALASFEALCKTYKNHAEYEREEYCASWFDPEYNDNSTYVRLVQDPIIIHNTPINEW